MLESKRTYHQQREECIDELVIGSEGLEYLQIPRQIHQYVEGMF
jgi:hypothetical protein